MTTNSKPLTDKQIRRLKKYMKQNKITQTHIGEINGISAYHISRACRGEYNITPRLKQQFLNAGIDLDEVILCIS